MIGTLFYFRELSQLGRYWFYECFMCHICSKYYCKHPHQRYVGLLLAFL